MTNLLLRAIGAATLAAGVAAAASPDFLPLASGNTWTYRDAASGQTFDVRVGTPLITNDRVYHPLRGFTTKQLFVRVNEFGNLAYWDEEREQELLLTSFETSPSIGSFGAYGRQCPASGRAMRDRIDYAGPAGRWSTQEVQFTPYACADAGELSEQYVENIGMVRRVVQTFAGPQVFDLVYAHLGQQVITAGEASGFSVTAIPSAAGGSWDATLRLDLNSSISVNFPSSQEYDLRLRDSQGKILWTWSADKIFAQTTHTVNLSRWKAAVVVPNPPSIPEGGQAYVLEAWLTTAPGEAQFAGATTLVLFSPARDAVTDGSRRR
jgi:hypothetical protein